MNSLFFSSNSLLSQRILPLSATQVVQQVSDFFFLVGKTFILLGWPTKNVAPMLDKGFFFACGT